jgi:hypothetical protein
MKRLLSLIFTLFNAAIVRAEGSKIVHDFVEISFKPVKAEAVVVDAEKNIFIIPAVILENSEISENKIPKSYIIGVKVDGLVEQPQLMSVVVYGDGTAEFASTIKDISSSDLISDSAIQLRDKILAERRDLSELREMLNSEVFNLKKLRLEAGRIADLGRIIELDEDTRRLKEAGDAVERDIASLKVSLEAVKDLKEPRRFERRKVVLTEQLSELAKAALAAEQSAPSMKKTSESDLDRKLALIDATRFDDLDELEREYQSLSGEVLPKSPESLPLPESRDIQGADYMDLKEW